MKSDKDIEAKARKIVMKHIQNIRRPPNSEETNALINDITEALKAMRPRVVSKSEFYAWLGCHRKPPAYETVFDWLMAQNAVDDMSKKPQNIDTSKEHVHEDDTKAFDEFVKRHEPEELSSLKIWLGAIKYVRGNV